MGTLDDRMTWWLDDRMTRWPDDLMTRWPDRVTEWPSDRVTKWPSDQFHSKLLLFLLLLNSNIGKVALCKCSDTNIFKCQCPTWLFPSYGYPFICGNNERHWQSRYCYLVLELQLTMIIKLLQTVLYLESWQLLIMVKDNRLGGVDNICVLRRRTARNAVTRPTTGHSESGRSEDKHGTDRRHGAFAS